MGGNGASRRGHGGGTSIPGCDGEHLMESTQERIGRLAEYLI